MGPDGAEKTGGGEYLGPCGVLMFGALPPGCVALSGLIGAAGAKDVGLTMGVAGFGTEAMIGFGTTLIGAPKVPDPTVDMLGTAGLDIPAAAGCGNIEAAGTLKALWSLANASLSDGIFGMFLMLAIKVVL